MKHIWKHTCTCTSLHHTGPMIYTVRELPLHQTSISPQMILYHTRETHVKVHAHIQTHTHTPSRSPQHPWNTHENICTLALLTHTATLPNQQCIFTCKHITRIVKSSFCTTTQAIHIDMYMYTHVHTHVAGTQTSDYLVSSTYETHMKTYVHSHFWLILLLYQTSNTSCIHTYTHTRANMQLSIIKHLWNTHENICVLALLTHPSTLPHNQYI